MNNKRLNCQRGIAHQRHFTIAVWQLFC